MATRSYWPRARESGYKAATPDELAEKLRLAFQQEGPAIIDMAIGATGVPWRYILLPEVRSDRLLLSG